MKHKSNRFLGCFCFPGKSSEKKLLPEIAKSGSHRKKIRWLQRLRWSSFVVKKSDRKTVPVDVNRTEETYCLEPASKFESPAAGGKQDEIVVVPSDRMLPEEQVNEKFKNPINIIVDDNAASKMIDTHKNGLLFSCKKKIGKAKMVDNPDSPSVKKKSVMTRCKSQPAIFQSVFHPPPLKQKKQATTVAEATVANGGGRHKRMKENSKVVARKYDSVIGMLIITGILVVMLLWGKLCAILFTSAGLFFVSRFGVIMESNFKTKKEVSFEFNSEVYDKKKVVMEGILARNPRKVVKGSF